MLLVLGACCIPWVERGYLNGSMYLVFIPIAMLWLVLENTDSSAYVES